MTQAARVDQVAAAVHLAQAQTDAVCTQCVQAMMDAVPAGEVVA
jgi:hypothetical protein